MEASAHDGPLWPAAQHSAADCWPQHRAPSLNLRREWCRLLEAALGSHVDPDAAEQGLAGAAGVVPPQYVRLKEAARVQALEIKAKMGELRKLHGQVRLGSLSHIIHGHA